ncbi:MAG TPA: hypothetical protein VJU18_03540 [Vicinamibacteria bacterium]|nr:hypothetical protein [Vicinamibacteria bacterium]
MRRPPVALLGLALASASGVAAQAVVPAVAPGAGIEACSLLVRCGLSAPPPACTGPLSSGVPGVVYDDERCAEGRRLFAQGLSPVDPLGSRVYRMLGRRYRVVYSVVGEAPISQPRFLYLLDELPLAAKLLSRLQAKDYSAEYLDGPARRRFRGGRKGVLTGEAELIARDPEPGRLTYFGLGTSQVGFWSLRGLALLELEFAPVDAGRRLAYRISVVASPVNAFYDMVMRLGVFKGLVEGRLREVIGDITQAMAKLEGSPPSVLSSPDWTGEEKAKLTALLRLP